MRIKKLNEWKCGMDIDDADSYPEGALKDMIEHFGLAFNPRTGCYDCDGDVDLFVYNHNLSYDKKEEFDDLFVRNGKMTIKFGKVNGYFKLPGDCDNPYILTSLEGCPKTVGGDFSCVYNQLTSLEGSPEIVGGGFDCSSNQLTSLAGCTKIVGGGFDCSSNQLTSLAGSPKSVGGSFSCNNNKLTSLEGCPESVGGSFSCNNNKTVFTKKDVSTVCNVNATIFV